eukprot:5825466-Alexandrium_andersonii.AAC.1
MEGLLKLRLARRGINLSPVILPDSGGRARLSKTPGEDEPLEGLHRGRLRDHDARRRDLCPLRLPEPPPACGAEGPQCSASGK